MEEDEDFIDEELDSGEANEGDAEEEPESDRPLELASEEPVLTETEGLEDSDDELMLSAATLKEALILLDVDKDVDVADTELLEEVSFLAVMRCAPT